MLGSSRVAAQLAASPEGLGSMSDDDDDEYWYLTCQSKIMIIIRDIIIIGKTIPF
jgi:hypothetical protein